MREKDCFAPLSCGQDSQSATANVISRALPPTLLLTCLKTPQPELHPVLSPSVSIHVDTVVQILKNILG